MSLLKLVYLTHQVAPGGPLWATLINSVHLVNRFAHQAQANKVVTGYCCLHNPKNANVREIHTRRHFENVPDGRSVLVSV
ncbi:MAG: hypothetical protein JNN12_05110 [Bacteroidetes Order II. Incertae sedis bacterium]|nr:hypothetical protein [Bacteroidetes Order II. bacterium]